jgi:hypothetical protein
MQTQFQEPLEIGQSVDLTKWYEDQTGFIPDGRGGKACHVYGKLVHVADLDRPASNHFGRELLTWRLAVASRITNSQIKDISIQPVMPDSIGELQKRFPGAFDEFVRRYGGDQLPERHDSSPHIANMQTVGPYGGVAQSVEEYKEHVRHLRKIAPMGREERRVELQRKLLELESETPETAFAAEPEFGAPSKAGTPIVTFGAIPQNARIQLMQTGIQTVEAFAASNDAFLEGLGQGRWNAWRQRARDETGVSEA